MESIMETLYPYPTLHKPFDKKKQYTAQCLGVTFGRIPSGITAYLKLPNAHLYRCAGHGLHRLSVSILVDCGEK